MSSWDEMSYFFESTGIENGMHLMIFFLMVASVTLATVASWCFYKSSVDEE